MLREHNKIIVKAHKIIDICLTVISFIAAYLIKKYLLPTSFRGLTTAENYHLVLLMIIIIWYVIFSLFDLYASYRKRSFGKIFWNMVSAVSVAVLVLILFMYVLKIIHVSRIMMGIFFLLNIGLLATCKGLVYKSLVHYRKKGYNFRNILIVGCKERAKEVIRAIGDHFGSGLKVLGCIDLQENTVGNTVKDGIKIIGTVDDINNILLKRVVDEVIFAMPLSCIGNVHAYISFAEQVGVPVRIVPDWQIHRLTYQPGVARIHLEDFLGIPTLALTSTPQKKAEFLIKSAIDYIVGGIVFVLSLPLFLIISIAIKLLSRGSVFFKQERCGLNGRRFTVYKFRTMVVDAEEKRNELEMRNEVDGPVFKIKRDPRIIPYIGTVLRKTSLDELPQLINVLKGEMSLIGPRPPIPEEVEKYEIWQRRRLSMKPGLTCLWQSTPNRNEVSFDEWMSMDLCYIDNWSLGLDFKIFLKTTMVVLLGSGR